MQSKLCILKDKYVCVLTMQCELNLAEKYVHEEKLLLLASDLFLNHRIMIHRTGLSMQMTNKKEH